MSVTNLNRSTKGLLALSILGAFIIVLRIILKHEYKFSFLIWNLFLAWIPFWLILLAEKTRQKSLRFLILFVWLLFFPNAPYIITDLLHLKNYTHNIPWYDSLTIFTFASTGVLIALHTLQKAHQILENYARPQVVWALMTLCSFLTGFGVYLGRYCRLNSWDLFNRPVWFAGRILHQFENPLTYKFTLTFSFVFFAFYYIYIRFFASELKIEMKKAGV